MRTGNEYGQTLNALFTIVTKMILTFSRIIDFDDATNLFSKTSIFMRRKINGQKEKDKRTNNEQTGDKLRCFGIVSSSCSCYCRVNLVTNPMIVYNVSLNNDVQSLPSSYFLVFYHFGFKGC
jgi:hypothetical protein